MTTVTQPEEIPEGPRINMLERLERLMKERSDLIAVVALLISLVPRLAEAATTYLNPDEADYFLHSMPSGLAELYRSAISFTHHPPLAVMLIRAATDLISPNELSLRLPFVISGALFPWFVYRWLALVWNRVAGLLALLLLAFAPHLIPLSAQARGYTVSFLAIAACLYYLERAMERDSVRSMAVSAVALWIGILAEYSVAYFAAAAGIYFLLRVRRPRPPRRLLAAWALGQAGGVALYGFLAVTHVLPMLDSPRNQASLQGWLHGAFPWPGNNTVAFLALATVKQFAYLMASIPLGVVAVVPFLAGLWLFWNGRSPKERIRSRCLIPLVLLPFLMAASASLAHVHPYGRSRHTALLGILIAITIAVALERAIRSRAWIVLPAAILLIPVWHWVSIADQNNISRDRHNRKIMRAAVDHLRETVPVGALILTERDLRVLLRYYLGLAEGSWPTPPREPNREWGNRYRMVVVKESVNNLDDLAEAVTGLRAAYSLDSSEPIWFAEGGWDTMMGVHPGNDGLQPLTTRFGTVLRLFRVPGGFALPAAELEAGERSLPTR